MSTATWIEDTLSALVVDAARRITDPGLAARVLADEGRRITAVADARAQRLVELFHRPWRDTFGSLHCARCGGLMPGERGVDKPCGCAAEVAAA